MNPEDSATLTEAVRTIQAGGDVEEAEGTLYRLLYPSIYNLFKNHRRLSREDCQDLVQETFTRIFRSIHDFHFDSSVPTWALRIAVNIWANSVRHDQARKRQAEVVSLEDRRSEGAQAAAPSEPRDPEASPESRAVARDRLQLVQQSVSRLPDRMRSALLLHVGQGLSYEQVAELQQVSEETVKSQIREARRRIRSSGGEPARGAK